MKPSALTFALSLLLISSCDDFDLSPITNNYYDYSHAKKIATLRTYKIKSVDRNTLFFDEAEGDIRDKDLFDKGDLQSFNIDMHYRCKFAGSNEYFYFRMFWQDFKGRTMLYVHWDPLIPSYSNTTAEIEIVEVPFIQNGKTSVSTIGDSMTWLFHGKHYRYWWSLQNNNLKFVGNRTDLYGFGHDGEGGNSTRQVIDRMATFKKADIYVLLIGTNDRKEKMTVFETVENIQKIVNHLQKLNSKSRIYVLTIPPCVESQRDEGNKEVNRKVKAQLGQGADNVTVLDVEKLFRDRKNWGKELLFDGLHPNDDGYNLLVNFLSENIK